MANLYPFQLQTVERVLKEPLRRLIVSFAPGLGKTATAIEVAKRLAAQRILVVCPAVVRTGWLRELDQWWPEHPLALSISLGRKREKGLSKPAKARLEACYAAPVQIVSYDLLEEVDAAPWDLIVFDEGHRCKSPTTKQTKAAKRVALANPQAAMLLLTATPMANEPCDVWQQLDLLWPGRFGLLGRNGRYCFKFNTRYAQMEHNGYGWEYHGVNELHAEELRERLKAVSTRITKQEVAGFLPPFITRQLRVGAGGVRGDAPRSVEDYERFLVKAGEEKIGPALEWLEDAVQGSNKIVVFTYGVALAEKIAERCQEEFKDIPVVLITGQTTADKRQLEIDRFTNAPRAIAVCSMKSVGVGVNGLECATDVLFAELYFRPETVEQALGRFNRLSSKEPTTVSILILEGTIDEAVAASLQAKLSAIGQTVKADGNTEKLDSALSEPESDEEFLAKLAKFESLPVDNSEYLD